MKNQHCENCGVHKDMHAGVGCKTFVQPKENKTAEELFHAAFSGLRIQRSNEYKLGVLSHLEYKLGEKPECKCPYEEGSAAFDAFWSGVTESWLILEKNEQQDIANQELAQERGEEAESANEQFNK
jgi:hypothetical protein